MSVEGWACAGWASAEHAQEHHQSEPKVSRSACAPWQHPAPLVSPCPVSAPAQPEQTVGPGHSVGGGPLHSHGLRCPLPANRFRCVSWFSLSLTLTQLRSSQQLLALNSVSQDSGHATLHMTTWHMQGSRQVEHTWSLQREGGTLKGDTVPCPDLCLPAPSLTPAWIQAPLTPQKQPFFSNDSRIYFLIPISTTSSYKYSFSLWAIIFFQ